MAVEVKKVEQGIAMYLDKEFIPQLPADGVQRVLVGTAVSIMIRRGSSMLQSFKDHPLAKMLGLFDESGNVDIEIVLEELAKNMPADGLQIDVPLIGILTFRKSDVDKLYNHIVAAVAE